MAISANMVPVSALHEALVEHKRVFLSNVVARVYRRATELPPMLVREGHPAEGHDAYLVACSDTLEEWNKRIRRSQAEVEEWRKEGKTPPRRVGKSAQRPLWTPESFAAQLISVFGWDGKPRGAADICSADRHEEDVGREDVRAHWLILDEDTAAKLERSATEGRRLLDAISPDHIQPGSNTTLLRLMTKVMSAFRCHGNRWHTGEIGWGYVRVLEDAIKMVGDLANHLGGGESGETVPPKVHERFRLAHDSYQWVAKNRPDLIPDAKRTRYNHQIYELVKEECPIYGGPDGPSLPLYETWKRYVREYERRTQGAKHTPRKGREHGRSIVRHDQVEYLRDRDGG